MESRVITDTELTAYLDGEATSELRAEIEDRLAEDAPLANRLGELDVLPAADIASAFDPVLDAAPEFPAALTETPAARWWPAAAAVALLAVGTLTGYAFGSGGMDEERGWHDYVAAYHALYVPETLSETSTDAESDLESFSVRMGLDLAPAADASSLIFRLSLIHI